MSSGTITLRELWDDYGIVGEILVSIFQFTEITGSLSHVFVVLAIYDGFPTCRYPPSHYTGPLTPAYQRRIQGPRCHLDRKVHQENPLAGSGRQDPGGY